MNKNNEANFEEKEASRIKEGIRRAIKIKLINMEVTRKEGRKKRKRKKNNKGNLNGTEA